MIIKLSFNIRKLENNVFNIIFNDLTFVTDLRGLKTLSVLKACKSYNPKTIDKILKNTMMKSITFQLSLKYAFSGIIKLKIKKIPLCSYFYGCFNYVYPCEKSFKSLYNEIW